MPELKLQKVSDRLYHQPFKDGNPLRWEKRLKFLHIKLTNVRVNLGVSISRSRRSDEKYSEYFGWSITAMGNLTDRLIGLIRNDGTISANEFDSVEVILSPQRNSEKDEASGWLSYNNGDSPKQEDRPQPYLTLDLTVPRAALKDLCSELLSRRLVEVNLVADVDVFESEAERWVYFVEEAELFNTAFLSSLNASRLVDLAKTSSDDCEKVEQDRSEKDSTGAAAAEDHKQPTVSFSVKPELVGFILRRLEMIGMGTVVVAIILLLMLLFK